VLTLTHCPACGSSASTTVASLDEDRRERFLAYSSVKYGGALDCVLEAVPPVISGCTDCGHFWYRNQPDGQLLGRMYAAGRPLIAGGNPSRAPSAAMHAEMARLRRLTERPGRRPTLLDYGSGYGRWAHAAVAAGFEVTAFEPSAERGAGADAGFKLVHDLMSLRGQRFAVIQLEQVLEHVADPLAALKNVRSFCDADTVVRITVPNMLRATEGRTLWSAWPFDGHRTHIMAPYEHLHGFTPKSLDRLLRRACFEPIPAKSLLRHYPSVPLRSLLGAAFPSIGTTLRLVTPAAHIGIES